MLRTHQGCLHDSCANVHANRNSFGDELFAWVSLTVIVNYTHVDPAPAFMRRREPIPNVPEQAPSDPAAISKPAALAYFIQAMGLLEQLGIRKPTSFRRQQNCARRESRAEVWCFSSATGTPA